MSSDQNPAPPGPSGGPGGTRRPGEPGWPRWSVFVLLGVILLVLIGSSLLTTSEGEPMSYGDFLEKLENDEVAEATFNNTNGHITGELDDGTQFSANGPIDPPDADTDLMAAKGVEFETPESSVWLDLIIWTAPLLLFLGFFIWLQRRAQSQMGSVMSIGRSRAKTYSAERPGTTFDDVAGYDGVKQEITEVVDFLKYPERFGEIGARIPKGVLLVGPPGTGKTLIARAVAGEAGVPFLSVSGSDFMEMFVGVGASRVRDLFNSATWLIGRAEVLLAKIVLGDEAASQSASMRCFSLISSNTASTIISTLLKPV